MRIGAGAADNDTLEALEVEYLGQLRSHSGFQKGAMPYLERPEDAHPSSVGNAECQINAAMCDVYISGTS